MRECVEMGRGESSRIERTIEGEKVEEILRREDWQTNVTYDDGW